MSSAADAASLIVALMAAGKSPEEAGRAAAAALGLGTASAAPSSNEPEYRLFQMTPRYRRWKKEALPDTYRRVTHAHIRHLLRHAGKMRWQDFTPQWTNQYKRDRSAERTYKGTLIMPDSINVELNTLYAILSSYLDCLNYTKGTRRIPYHPMKGWTKLEVDTDRRDFYIDPAGVVRFLMAANPILRMMTILSCEMGFRRGEILRLEWTELDFAHRRVSLQARKTKGKRKRHIVITDVALEVLNTVPRHVPSRYVFANPRRSRETGLPGEPYPVNTVSNWLEKAREEAGLINLGHGRDEPAWLHSFRKSWASMALARGMPKDFVQEQGGWSNEEIMRMYQKFSPEYMKKSLEHMNANPDAVEILGILRGERRGPQAAASVPTPAKQSADRG